jgi:serine/threonine-protein kinase
MAPEQALGNASGIDARTDVFALGAVLYEVLTQRPPYVAPTTTAALLLAAAGRVTSPQEVTPEPLPPVLCEIAMRAMSREPAQRYQTVDELHDDLEHLLRGGGWFATRVFAPGQLIVREGEQADAAYLIVRGRCQAFHEGENGERARLRLMGPGEVFGETALLSAALLSAQRRAASVAAIDVVTVKVVTAAALEREMDRSSWMHAVVKQLATRLLDLECQPR